MFFVFHIFCSCTSFTENYEEYKFFLNEEHGITEKVLNNKIYIGIHLKSQKQLKKGTILERLEARRALTEYNEKVRYQSIESKIMEVNAIQEKEMSKKDKEEIRNVLQKQKGNLYTRVDILKSRFIKKIFKDLYKELWSYLVEIKVVKKQIKMDKSFYENNKLYKIIEDHCKHMNDACQVYYKNMYRFLDDRKNKPITIQKMINCSKISVVEIEKNLDIIHSCLIGTISEPKIHDNEEYFIAKIDEMNEKILKDISCDYTIYTKIIDSCKTPNRNTQIVTQTNIIYNIVCNPEPKQDQTIEDMGNAVTSMEIWLDDIRNAVRKEKTHTTVLDKHIAEFKSEGFLETKYSKFLIEVNKIIDDDFRCTILELNFGKIEGYLNTLHDFRVKITQKVIQDRETNIKALSLVNNEFQDKELSKDNKLKLFHKQCEIFETMINFFFLEVKTITEQLDEKHAANKRINEMVTGCETPLKKQKRKQCLKQTRPD